MAKCKDLATTEQSRLNWVKLNQSKIRAETYQGLTDAVTADPTTHGRDLGQRLILPSSFSGSSRNMIQHCQDALAINRYFHGADLFLTMTADPNWPEIKESLLPGQTSADRPDLVVRVFNAKVMEMKEDLFTRGHLGKTVQYFTLPHLLRRTPADSMESTRLHRTPVYVTKSNKFVT